MASGNTDKLIQKKWKCELYMLVYKPMYQNGNAFYVLLSTTKDT